MNNLTLKEFESRREITREPECPTLDAQQIKIISETVFISSNPQKADILFVFGSSYGDKWIEVAELYKKGFAPRIYIAGGIGIKSFESGRILSHIIRDDFLSFGVPNEAIIVDEHSTNTLEDAKNGRELFEKLRIPFQSILFACKSPHSGRCMRTLQKVFPTSNLFPFIYDYVHKGSTISPNDWWKHEVHRSLVWGEYQRIKLYSARGDIHE